jgi:tripartite-type tricarboxylate transporter receptor subunit TctC
MPAPSPRPHLAAVAHNRHPDGKPGKTHSGTRKKQGGKLIMKMRNIGVAIAAWLALLAAPHAGRAQESFPNRPVRIVVPYAAGSVTDVFARIVAQNMAAQWNGTIIVESKSGANGSIAADEVARAAPDGYTWLLVTTFFSATPALDPKLRWDPVRDYIAIGQVCRAPNFFIVPTTLPAKTVAEYVALAKAKPGTLNYSHPGKGSTGISASNCSSGWPESTSRRWAIAVIR